MKLRRQTNIACSIKVDYILALVQDLIYQNQKYLGNSSSDISYIFVRW